MNRVTMTELFRRVCEGDREAWAQFYEQFKREVIGVCVAILHNELAAPRAHRASVHTQI
ncbi:MAG: hypothetical protein NZ610_03210 [Candidatus Bipolaricaulota bacterium]|nr:hypothetical protein [Candidatus Bipolaricaulota bacterium]MCS7274400.1 hypothetical protein [Candidatus Bipolaricaulota bacterium]MDW8110256.1 hypothetical protein [Candidatus Bipolaricaulota bacterium]MDW8328844.1 hypothetical protein [Candidatus Bipolaricaulota bacterium]